METPKKKKLATGSRIFAMVCVMTMGYLFFAFVTGTMTFFTQKRPLIGFLFIAVLFVNVMIKEYRKEDGKP